MTFVVPVGGRFIVAVSLVVTLWSAVAASAAPGAPDAVVRGITTSRGGLVPLSGVVLTLTTPAGRTVAVVRSDAEGRFRFAPVSAGRFLLRTSALDLIDTERELDVPAGGVIDLRIELDLLPVSETIHVVPSATDPEVTTIGSRPVPVDGLVDEAPLVTGSVEEALALLPGVVQSPSGLSIRGSWRTGQTSAQLDDAFLADPSTGNKPVALPAGAVQTVEVLGAPFNANLGRFSAGATVFRPKSGANEWRTVVNGLVPGVRVDRENQLKIVAIDSFTPNVTVTGPIAKGRVFLAQSVQYFFTSWDAWSRPPDELSTQNELRVLTRVDASLSAAHTLTTTASGFGQRLIGANLDTFNPPEVTFDIHQTSWSVGVSDSLVVGTAGLVESQFQAGRYDVTVDGHGDLPMVIAPEENSGNYFNSQHREPWYWQWRESYSRSVSFGGDHRLRAGLDALHASYTGTSTGRTVDVRRVDGTLASRTTFSPEPAQHADGTDVAAFVEDRWRPNGRTVVELGWRVSHDGVSGTISGEPRAGVAVRVGKDGTSRFFAGAGVYRERLPLIVAAFEQFERRTVARYDADGLTLLEPPTTYVPVRSGALEPPVGMTWTVGWEQRLGGSTSLSASYLDRTGRHEPVVDPRQEDGGILAFTADGRSRFRSLDVSVSHALRQSVELSASYTRAVSTADLNAYTSVFGTVRDPLVRANEYGPTAEDVPHRLLVRGRAELAGRWLFVPVLDIRSGFPYSALDDWQDYVGGRNAAGRMPTQVALNISIERRVRVSRWTMWLGVRLFNVLNQDAPVDVQENIHAPDFRQTYGSVPFRYRLSLRLSR
jgi:hypothetical protein